MTTDYIGLEWTSYVKRVERSRVLDFFKAGQVEYELCGEGGQWVIRRTERTGTRVVVTEAARGRPRDVVPIWALLAGF